MARPRRRNLKKLKTAENPRMEAAKMTMCTEFRNRDPVPDQERGINTVIDREVRQENEIDREDDREAVLRFVVKKNRLRINLRILDPGQPMVVLFHVEEKGTSLVKNILIIGE
ncbi:hypothetical protein OUZ56_032258 [Daphnia magna]|uniref:Uncharacterized protein n=1 Tax=Daphnia magna TaxID=35525 RepID=A0ABQ9ZWP7_9CRUS|nr:hypothetical protein OUZ56_032258 [Daphnia magna]